MSAYQTNALVLKREDIFEADRLYHLYTQDFGKVRAIAGSVRKINAKLTGHLEPFNFVWVELVSKKGGELIITTALSHGLLLNNATPGQIALFTKMANFALTMLKEPQKDEVLWNFILEGFLKARDVENGSIEKFLSDFKSGFIKIMGFGDNFEEARYYLGDFNVL
ncbi:MAG: recombination protein O N-terminal domain-containing protein [Candidatus Azambacteria bacterium]|nr:recombination protein O N-terminal domain-containing protein [Candidatus Azambacteria bacterium]